MCAMTGQRRFVASTRVRTTAVAGSLLTALSFAASDQAMAGCSAASLLTGLASFRGTDLGSVSLSNPYTVSGSVCGQSFSLTSPVALNSQSNLGTQLVSVYSPLSSATVFIDGIPVSINTQGTLKAFYNSLPSLNSVSLYVAGVPVTISVPGTFASYASMNTLTAQVNGRSLTVTTTAASFSNLPPFGTPGTNYNIAVNGSVLYSGNGSGLTIQNGLDLLTLLGINDSYTVVQQTITREQSRVVASVTSDRITSMLTDVLSPTPRPERSASAGMTGIAAGDGPRGISVWFSPSNTWTSSSDPVNRFSGTLQNFLLGADYKFSPNSLGGIVMGFENESFVTPFNGGTLGNQGIAATPYFGLSMLDHRLVWNVISGYTYNMGRETRAVFGSPDITGNFTGQRWLFSTNLTGVLAVGDNLSVLPTVGFLAAWDHRFKFRESSGDTPLKNDSGLGEGRFGAKVVYALDNLDIYGGGYYLRDFFQDQDITEPNTHVGRDEMQLLAGINWYVNDRQKLTAEVSNSFFRKDISQTVAQLNYRLTF